MQIYCIYMYAKVRGSNISIDFSVSLLVGCSSFTNNIYSLPYGNLKLNLGE